MTVNQIINRVKAICLAHQQIRTFQSGISSDQLNDQTTRYPAILFQDVSGQLSSKGNEFSFVFKLMALDLVNVAANSKTNEQDVQSDMFEVIKDLVSEMNKSIYPDWAVDGNNPAALLVEQFNDLLGGAYVELTIRVPWDQNICEVPTDALPGTVVIETDKATFDLEYVADANDVGQTVLNIPSLVGKKVLLVIRENNPLHKVSNIPDPAEFTWNDTQLGLGTEIAPLIGGKGERFVILFRNY